MAGYDDIGKKRGIIYTCNCGWFDRAHGNPHSSRAGIGAAALLKAISSEKGGADTLRNRPAFILSYRQDATKRVLGMTFFPGVTKTYVVRKGLSPLQKQQVALAIFMETSLAFERLQDSWISRKLTGSDSGFSEEDLPSNLIGFYKALDSRIDIDGLCKPVSIEASRRVWKVAGAVGKNKNKSFSPKFHACDECKEAPAFPKSFQQLSPAPKGEIFADWIPPKFGPILNF